MVSVTALHGFDHYGQIKRGQCFEVSETHAKALERSGLVSRNLGLDDPSQAAGTLLSALPAAQALPQTIVKLSDTGGRRKKVAALLL
ncbi:hypothetical protein [Paralcaligenes ginsengisoli]